MAGFRVLNNRFGGITPDWSASEDFSKPARPAQPSESEV